MANMQYDLLELRSVVLPRSVDDSSPHSSISLAISSTDFSPVSAFKLLRITKWDRPLSANPCFGSQSISIINF